MSNITTTNNAETIGQFLSAQKNFIANVIGGEERASHLMREVLSCVTHSPELAKCDKLSIINACIQAHASNISVSPHLGLAYLVPYQKKKDKKPDGPPKASLILSYKALRILAIRTGLFERIHATNVKEGELISHNPFYGMYKFNPIDYSIRDDIETVGYYAYLTYKNGFHAEIYMSKDAVIKHLEKYSFGYQTYSKLQGERKENHIFHKAYETMFEKTVLRKLIKNYADFSCSSLVNAVTIDGACFNGEKVTETPDFFYPEAEESEEKTPQIEESTSFATQDFDLNDSPPPPPEQAPLMRARL